MHAHWRAKEPRGQRMNWKSRSSNGIEGARGTIVGPACGGGQSLVLAAGSPHLKQLRFSGWRKENTPARPSLRPGEQLCTASTGAASLTLPSCSYPYNSYPPLETHPACLFSPQLVFWQVIYFMVIYPLTLVSLWLLWAPPSLFLSPFLLPHGE